MNVIVAGGSIAVISAALAVARQGKSVLLLEKMFMLGSSDAHNKDKVVSNYER